ncbi:MAG: FAD-dependent oxidoreductase [Candidatus Limivivens sp.]|nr:FAD-dependent oxidoreductase [Candidatus Limivivens sp.]
MIRIQQLKLPCGHTEQELRRAVLAALSVTESELISFEIRKKSLDARKKPRLFYSYVIDAQVKNQSRILKKKKPGLAAAEPRGYEYPQAGTEKLRVRPVIVGTGPAGLFCGLVLSRMGYRPLLLERGEDVDTRREKVDAFWQTGILDPFSNVQFGEGGAGTFSDGKLNTAVKDVSGRNYYVLKSFVEAGAPEEILYLNKPHIGTDILRTVVKNIRKEILFLGGEIRFRTCLTDLFLKDGALSAVELNGAERMDCQVLVLAIGHSARDTFEMLSRKPICMEQKPFAVGVRIEHPQEMIDLSQYGQPRGEQLPAADYKLTRNLENGRGVYSFCMCPGGYVVNASSEQGRLAVNGMSCHARDGRNANSAMVVTVSPTDFGSEHVLAGMEFQRRLERLAYQAAGGKVPVQLLGDFCSGRKSTGLGEVLPSIRGQWELSDVRSCFPESLAASLTEGILDCGRMIRGFDRPDAVLSGVESRTSSPVRILRGESLESSIAGLYPCGEGAGYAGGITSAAMDGIKTAEALIRRFRPN